VRQRPEKRPYEGAGRCAKDRDCCYLSAGALEELVTGARDPRCETEGTEGRAADDGSAIGI
jgi:hypothetical protein